MGGRYWFGDGGSGGTSYIDSYPICDLDIRSSDLAFSTTYRSSTVAYMTCLFTVRVRCDCGNMLMTSCNEIKRGRGGWNSTQD